MSERARGAKAFRASPSPVSATAPVEYLPRMLKRREGIVAAALALWISACGSAKMGAVGEDCYPNGTCNDTLVCKAGKCVADSGGAGGDSGTGGSNTTSSGSTTSSSGTGGGTTTSSGSGSTTSSSGASGNMPPQILVLGTNVSSITEGEAVSFTAVVTDPDGIDDVIGGTLGDGNGNYYGAFATTGQEGAYQMILSWGQIGQVEEIVLATATPASRTFVAEFFDQAGHSVQKSVDVSLDCKMLGACKSHCMDLENDPKNCGGCGQSCAAGVACYLGSCAKIGACLGKFTSCSAACASAGQTCGDKCGPASNLGGMAYTGTTGTTCSGNPINVTCNQLIAAAPMACCCF